MKERMLTSQLADKLVDYLYDPLDVKNNFGLKITDNMIDWNAVKQTIGKPEDWNETRGSQLRDFFKVMLEKTALGDLDENCCGEIRRNCHCQEYRTYYNSLTDEEKAKLKIRVKSGFDV